MDRQGKVQLSKEETVDIVNVLLLRMNPSKKLSDYRSNEVVC